MNKFSKLFDDRTYESQVIVLVSGLATLRVAIAAFSGVLFNTHKTFQLINEFVLLAIFAGMLWYSIKNQNSTKISPLLGVLIIILLGINFVQFDGTAGTSEFNYFSGIYLIVVLYTGVPLSILLGFQLLLLAGLIAIQLTDQSILAPFLIKTDVIYIDFIFSLISISILNYFLKKITIDKTDKLEQLSAVLSKNTAEMKRKNHQLIEQGKQLQALHQYLESEIKQRGESLEAQNEAIEKYIFYNTDHINEPLKKLTNAIKNHPNKSMLDSLLHITSNELNEVVLNIKETLERDGHIDRNKIKR